MELVDKEYFQNLKIVHHQSKAASNELEYSEVGTLITVGTASEKHAHEILEGVKAVIRNAPTVDAEPVRHGHWIHKFGYNGERHTVCSSCGHDRCGHFSFSFCMDCGAKMDGPEKGDEQPSEKREKGYEKEQ